MFTLTIWVMLQTLDENVPRHQDRIANPGKRLLPGPARPRHWGRSRARTQL